MPTLTKDQQKWIRESDAHSLAEAERIKADPTRFKGAQSEAKKMAEATAKQAQALKKVAGKTSSKQPQKSKK